MKKFLSYFCYIAIAIASVSFVSCGNDDDDDILKPESKPEDQKISIYAATIDDNVLDIYDIKLNLYRNAKKQEVVLTKSMIAPLVGGEYDHKNYYCCSSVNGVEGVDSVIAEVSIKSDIDAIIASKDPKGECYVSCYARLVKVDKVANGDYSSYCEPATQAGIRWESLKEEKRGGIAIEIFMEDAIHYLTRK